MLRFRPDCFYEGDNILVINPDECIDCGVCEPECPADAILPDASPKFTQDYTISIRNGHKNASVITDKQDPLPDADALNPNGYARTRQTC